MADVIAGAAADSAGECLCDSGRSCAHPDAPSASCHTRKASRPRGRGFLPISARKSEAAGATPGPGVGDVGAVLKTRPAAQTCDNINTFVSDSFEECSQGSKVRYVGYGFYGPQCAQTSWGSNCGACFGNRSSFGGERQAISTHHTSAAVQTPVYHEMLHRIHNHPPQLCRPARIPSTNHSKKS